MKLYLGVLAGGGLDIITRTLAQKLSTQWGKQVLVDNKPGAGSTLGTALAAKAPKDGHARRDFAPLALVATTPEAGTSWEAARVKAD